MAVSASFIEFSNSFNIGDTFLSFLWPLGLEGLKGKTLYSQRFLPWLFLVAVHFSTLLKALGGMAASVSAAALPPLFCAPKQCEFCDDPNAVQFEIKAVISETETFQNFVRSSSDGEIVRFFRSVTAELEEQKLVDFHFKLCNRFNFQSFRSEPGCEISASYRTFKDDSAAHKGPLEVQRCMSCDLECPLEIGVLGKGDSGPRSKDSLIEEGTHIRTWLDAKGRPMLILTPLRHVEEMRDLSDDELVSLWRSAVKAMDELGLRNFNALVINQGNNRNHAHLHLKAKFRPKDFDRAIDSSAFRGQLERIRKFAERDLGRSAANNYYAPRPTIQKSHKADTKAHARAGQRPV